MSLAEQIQAINDGLFDPEFPPDSLEEVLSNGTFRAVNWHRIRPAIEALKQMAWYNLDRQWEFFLEPDRYPEGHPVDLRPDEVGIFQDLIGSLVNDTAEGIRILSSVHPRMSLTDVTVTINSTDLENLAQGLDHVRRTTELAAIDDAIVVSSLQSGSIDIVLTAGRVSLYGLQLAILLARIWKNPQITEKVRTLRRLWERAKPTEQMEEQTLQEVVLEEAKESFWQSAGDSLKIAVEAAGKNAPEAQSKINQAAREIFERSGTVSADWKLPPAIIYGLPGGLMVSLNYDDPESIGRVIRALSSPPEGTDTLPPS